jgi:hypothetical protein
MHCEANVNSGLDAAAAIVLTSYITDAVTDVNYYMMSI